MSANALRRIRPSGDLAQTGVVALLLALAAMTWALTHRRMAGMDAGPGSDLGGPGWFAASWALMMAAAAGLLAARPTVVCPFQGDQHFWGAAVQRAGAGPAPLPAKKVTPERLASAIQTVVGDSAMQNRALELAKRIAQEDGAGKASEQIEVVLAD